MSVAAIPNRAATDWGPTSAFDSTLPGDRPVRPARDRLCEWNMSARRRCGGDFVIRAADERRHTNSMPTVTPDNRLTDRAEGCD